MIAFSIEYTPLGPRSLFTYTTARINLDSARRLEWVVLRRDLVREVLAEERNLLEDVLLQVRCMFPVALWYSAGLTLCTLGTPSKKNRAKIPAETPNPAARVPLQWVLGLNRGMRMGFRTLS